MPPDLAKFLASHLAGKSETDFVCEAPRGGMLKYDSYLRALKSFCKKIGITVVTPHELRHSATELYVEVGASQEDVSRLLQHQSSATTKRYMHRTPDRLNHLASQIAVTHAASLKLVK